MKNASILSFEPKFTFSLVWRIPLAFVIRFFTWGLESHVAVIMDGKVCEQTGALGYSETEINIRLAKVPKNVKVCVREPINDLSIDDILIARNFCQTQRNIKYGIGAATFTAVNSIPIINKINFGNKKSACSIFATAFLKVVNFLPEKVNAFDTNPKELCKRLDKSGLYQKKRLLN